MKSLLLKVHFLLLIIVVASSGQLTVNTPNYVVVCQPLLLTWSGGMPPYFLSVLPGSEPGAPALFSFPSQNGKSLTWTPNFSPGTRLGLSLKDSTGDTAQSVPFTIQGGPDTRCVNTKST